MKQPGKLKTAGWLMSEIIAPSVKVEITLITKIDQGHFANSKRREVIYSSTCVLDKGGMEGLVTTWRGLIRAMPFIFSNLTFDYGVNQVLSWFDIELMASFKDITQNMFCILARISPQADLKIYYFNLPCYLCWWHLSVNCQDVT